MGGFSPVHVLVLLAVFGVPTYFGFRLLLPTKLRRRAAAWFEHRAYEGRTPPPPPVSFPLALPWVFLIWGGVALAVSALVVSGSLVSWQLNAALLASTAIGWLGILAGAFVHLRPNHSRALKYTLVIAPTAASAPLWAAAVLTTGSDPNVSPPEVVLVLAMTQWAMLSMLMLAVFGGLWLRRRWQSGEAPRSAERSVFGLLRSPAAGPLLVAGLLVFRDLTLIALVLRFLVVERFRRHPIVYLRSFHHDVAVEAFGKIIAPAISRYGVICGLVHGTQTSSALMSKASIWQFGLMETVSDAHWQEWVGARLRTASLVIIDVSVLSSSVEWEIATALASVDAKRVLIITADREHTVPGVALLRYGTQREQLAQARTSVQNWAAAALL